MNASLVSNNIQDNTVTKQRFANLDLLRGICAIFVVYEHFCETSAHNAFGFSYDASLPAHIVLRLIYGIARTAVPVFFLLSGYLSINSKKQKLGKVINLFFMTSIYSLIPFLASCIISIINGNACFSLKEFLYSAFPRNYYLYLFCGIYVLMPFLNNAVQNLSKQNYYRLIVALFLLFSVWSTLINSVLAITNNEDLVGCFFTSRTGTSMGFNVANFITMYLIGGYLRLYYHKESKHSWQVLFGIILLSSFITTCGKILFPKISKCFYYYDSIFITVAAVAVFVLFLGIKNKPSRVVTFCGKHTFGTFMIHGFASACVEKIISIKTVVSNGFVGSFIGIIVFVLGVYILALILTSVLELIASPVNKYWKKSKLYNYTFYNDL